MQGGRKSSMATTPRYRIKTPTDVWSIKERLCLASSVLRSGDQNWVSVSRAIRPFGENNRPPDWFHQKNCALQYSDLLEKVETPKRKRGDVIDTPGDAIVRKLTLERIEELKKFINDEQQRHKKMRKEIEMVRCGQLDEKLDDIWRGIQDEMRAKEIADTEHQKWLKDREIRLVAMKAAPKALFTVGKNKRSRIGINEVRRNSSQSEQSEQDTVDSPLSEPLSIEVDDVTSPLPGMLSTDGGTVRSPVRIPVSSTHGSITTTSTSPLLTSLLKSPSPATAPSTGMMSPTTQGKDVWVKNLTPTTPPTPPRLTSTPQPFFNPSSALATAAARQLAVATAASICSSPSALLFSNLKSVDVPRSQSHGIDSISVTSSAPTLSKLLEMPPSMPGKLPPLPIIRMEQPQLPASTSVTSIATFTNVTTTTSTHLPLVNVDLPVASSESRVTPSTPISQNIVTDFHNISVAPQHTVAELVEQISLDIPEVQQLTKLDRKDEYDTFESEASLDMDMEAIVNEIMKEDIVVETTDQLDEQLEKVIDECDMLEQVANESILTTDHAQAELIAACIKEEISAQVKEEESLVDVENIVEFEKDVSIKSEPTLATGANEVEKSVEFSLSEKENLIIEVAQDGNGVSEVIEIVEDKVKEEYEPVLTEQPESEISIAESPIKEEPDLEESSEDLDKPLAQHIQFIKRGRGRPSKASLLQQKLELERREELEDKMADTTDEERTPGDDKEDSKSVFLEEESKDSASNPMEDLAGISETAPPSCQPESADENDQKHKAPSSVSDSVPNSPVSTPLSDDQESLRDYKVWKKAIMLVWRAAANHKYANVFLHPVTNDMAPGYHSIVYRPMDLSMIKKNIEMGMIKTTAEFQRDMMLMFQNAIMYNSSDHDVYQMAIEMQKEVMEVIQDFLATQLMVQTSETKVLRGRESRDRKNEGGNRTDSESRDDDGKKKRISVSEMESKTKKRKD